MDQGASPQEGGYLKVASDGSVAGRCPSPMNTEDYVMVPENLPSDHSASSADSHRPPSSVDLNALFRYTSKINEQTFLATVSNRLNLVTSSCDIYNIRFSYDIMFRKVQCTV